jgi:hypothetical protein
VTIIRFAKIIHVHKNLNYCVLLTFVQHRGSI